MSLYIKLHENQSLFQQTTPQGGHVMKKVFKKGRKSKEKDHACLNREPGVRE